MTNRDPSIFLDLQQMEFFCTNSISYFLVQFFGMAILIVIYERIF